MPLKSIADSIIPGYESLPQEIQVSFQGSQSGQKFIALTHNVVALSEQKDNSSWWWQSFTGTTAEKDRVFQEQVDIQIKDFITSINETEGYKLINMHLTLLLLKKEIEEFQLLTKEQQEVLSKAEFSKKLLASLNFIDAQIEKEQREKDNLNFFSQWQGKSLVIEEQLTQLQVQREEAIRLWKTNLLERPEMASFRKTIETKQQIIRQELLAKKRASLHEHAKQLSTFFPILNYRKFTTEDPIITQLRTKYTTSNGEIVSEPDKVDEELLTDILYFCMQQMNHIEMNFMNLDSFNKKYANRMALAILKIFNDKSELNLDSWFLEYENKLHQHIIKRLQLINGKTWEISSNSLGQELVHSLSFLWNNQAVNRVNEFFNKMGDAHGFIQATSFSTQNESSFLAILDMYNYARHHEQISETRAVIASLLSPLLPLYNEYKDIGLYEKNVYMKTFRSIIPIAIVVAAIILVAVILAPLALPELAFTAAFILALIIGLALATKYVSVKNDIYKNLREQYYGGPFEIPEYQVNPRMISAFGTKENALKVKNFYINELKKCGALESTYNAKHDQGLLTQEDIDLRKENTKKRYDLSLEWYDLHSNKDLNYQQAPIIVVNRLRQTCDQEYHQLQNSIQEEFKSIRQSVSEVTSDLKDTIVKNNTAPIIEQENQKEIPTIKTNYRNGLFTPPRSLQIKTHMEELANFSAQISLAAG